ncbi:hypothetical protein GCM10009601_05870 [Streptomyces thermospinosisporus]|uniref:Uncharacterized protein n=1 Tax=Streptomyces thermospinosisporus TaxID=161482 RepID=A0ABP4J880_9ACTN
MGRHLFGLVNGWEGHPPTGDHVVIVSHRPKPEGWHPEASRHFTDSLTAAIDKARKPAGDRVVAVNAGEAGGQLLTAGGRPRPAPRIRRPRPAPHIQGAPLTAAGRSSPGQPPSGTGVMPLDGPRPARAS